MPFLARDLEDMRVGWQQVADRYGMTVYVFKHTHPLDGDHTYMAVTNSAQGVGSLFETLTPRTTAEEHKSAAGRFEIARCEPTQESGK